MESCKISCVGSGPPSPLHARCFYLAPELLKHTPSPGHAKARWLWVEKSFLVFVQQEHIPCVTREQILLVTQETMSSCDARATFNLWTEKK